MSGSHDGVKESESDARIRSNTEASEGATAEADTAGTGGGK